MILRNYQFVIFYTIIMLSGLADGLLSIVISWLVFAETKSCAASGFLFCCLFLPRILLCPLSGRLVDFYSKSYIIFFSFIIQAGIVFVFILMRKHQSMLIVYMCIFLLGSCTPFIKNASRALVPGLCSPGQLVKTNALFESHGFFFSIIGRVPHQHPSIALCRHGRCKFIGEIGSAQRESHCCRLWYLNFPMLLSDIEKIATNQPEILLQSPRIYFWPFVSMAISLGCLWVALIKIFKLFQRELPTKYSKLTFLTIFIMVMPIKMKTLYFLDKRWRINW
jgi:hypothetical protein